MTIKDNELPKEQPARYTLVSEVPFYSNEIRLHPCFDTVLRLRWNFNRSSCAKFISAWSEIGVWNQRIPNECSYRVKWTVRVCKIRGSNVDWYYRQIYDWRSGRN
jgi:hypothetical protein